MFSGLPFGLAVVALSALAAHAHARQGENAGARQRMTAEAQELASSVKAFVARRLGERPPLTAMRGLYVYGLGPEGGEGTWRALGVSESGSDEGEGNGVPVRERAVVLVHGLDDLGDIWDDLAPAIRADAALGKSVDIVRFEYANDQAAPRSAGELYEALKELKARGVTRVDLVCHSLGGLVARDVLTRPTMYGGRVDGHTDLPEVTRLILLGTPNLGSPFARLQWICEAREKIVRWAKSEDKNVRDLYRFDNDGSGEAADDLMPGSAYLSELNARGMPARDQLPVTVVIGTLTSAEDLKLDRALALPLVEKVLGPKKAASLLESGRTLTRDLGDGVVSTRSAWLDGAEEAIYVEASHRGMVRHLEIREAARKVVGRGGEKPVPPAIPFILTRLRGDAHGAP